MKDKKVYVDRQQKGKSPSLQIVRQQLRNKLIEIGLQCNQHKQPSQNSKPNKKRINLQTYDKHLPLIFSLKNSLNIGKESSSFSPHFEGIFSHRDIFMNNEVFVGSKLIQPQSKPPSPASFRQHFQKKIGEEVKHYKMQQKSHNLRNSQRKQKLRTQTDDTIVIRALKRVSEDSQEDLQNIYKAKLRSNRSKTEQQKPKQIKKIKQGQNTQYRRLTPWGQSNQIVNWPQQS